MATERGYGDVCDKIVAHALGECGSMSEYCDWQHDTARKWTNDNGWAVGLFQFHLKWRYADWLEENDFVFKPNDPDYTELVRHKFFEDHPEMKDFRGQVIKYLNELDARGGDIDAQIKAWNNAAGYVQKIKGFIPKAQKLLNS